MYARELRKWSLKYQITYMWLTALVTMLLFIIYCPNAASMHLPNTNTALRIPSTDSSTYNWWLDKLSTSYTRSNRNIDSNINLNSNSNSNSNSDSSSNLSSRLSISNKNPLEVFSDFQNHNARAKARIRTRARARANATNTNTNTITTVTETTNTIYNNSNHQLHQQHQQQQQHNSNNNNYVPNVPNLNSQLNLNSYANSLTKNAYDYSTSTSDSDNDNDSSDRSNKLRRHTIQPNANYHSPVRVGGKSSSPPYTLLAHHHLPSSVHPLRYAIATFHVPPESLSSSSVVSALSQPSASTSASSSLPASISSTSSKSVKFDEHRRRMLLRQQAHNRTMLLAARSRRDSATLNSPLGFLRQSAATSTGNYNYQKHHHNRNSNHHNHRKRPRRYCSARDPAQLAFEAPTVIEGKIISMTSDRRANFSATVEVKKVFKQQIGYRLQGYLRLQFAYRNTSAECDIYREFLRPRGLVRGDELEQGRIYVMFVQQIDLSNFTILGQPIRKTRRVIEAVNNAVSENYAQLASIKSITASNRTVENGKELRIVCKVQGQPPPKVTWFKDHKSINRNRKLYQFIHYKRRSELIIKSFNSSDAGRYECRAKNKVNRDLQRRAIVIKAYPMPRYDAPTQQSGGQCPENAHEFCFNGGTCKFFTEIGSYSCICPEGFIGERCDRKEVNNMPPIPTYKTGYIADDPNVFDEDSAESELYESDEDDEDDDFTYPPTKDPFYNKFLNSNKYI